MDIQYEHIAGIIAHVESTGCKDFVICPGSRNAPIVDYLTRHSDSNIYSHIDERSAGYVALGIAKKLNKPVAIVCTSGTAALNFAPAIAEAYYQNICLIAITADRPINAVNSFESQTINQSHIFQNFVASQLSIDMSAEWSSDLKSRIISETDNALIKNLPIHLNLHLAEPLYNMELVVDEHRKLGNNLQSSEDSFLSYQADKNKVSTQTITELSKYNKALVFLGFDVQKEDFEYSNKNLPILADPCSSNFKEGTVFNYDFFLGKLNEKQSKELQPEVLITSGTYMLSKQLRNWLKKYPPLLHIHIGKQAAFVSPFAASYKILNVNLKQLMLKLDSSRSAIYYKEWSNLDEIYQNDLSKKVARFSSPFYRTLEFFLQSIKSPKLHCGNSMSVRYGALFQSLNKKFDTLISNRGTSGIDGCMSTFLGYASSSNKKQWLLVGDVSFFYDNNAFWLLNLPNDFVIIVINNGGGKIFDVIKGPEKMERRKLFISNPHKKSVKQIAQMHKIKYHKVQTLQDAKALRFEKQQRKIVEIVDDHPNTVNDYQNLFK